MTVHVLVIDDDNSVRASLSRVLRGGGYVVSEACSGAEGMTLAERTRPDVILMDMVMEDHEALDTVRLLKTHPTLATVPIIALTASPDRAHGDASSFVAVLTKPCRSADLFRAIEARRRRPKH